MADLAAEATLSRSAFARRFTELLGAAPLAYLTEWRMALARERLRDSDAGRLAAIARSLGYGSEFAFAAAFKRHHGARARPLARRRGGETVVRGEVPMAPSSVRIRRAIATVAAYVESMP